MDSQRMVLTSDQDKAIERLAKQMDLTPDAVRETIGFSMSITDQARERHLTLRQALASLMSAVSDLLHYNLPPLERAKMATNISEGLWTNCGLPSDSAPESDSPPNPEQHTH